MTLTKSFQFKLFDLLDIIIIIIAEMANSYTHYASKFE